MMDKTRRLLWSAALLIALLGSGCSGESSGDPVPAAGSGPAPRTYELPYRGTLTLEVPEPWVEQVRVAAGGLATSVEYRPPADDTFRVAISIRWSLGEDRAFNGPERLEQITGETLAALTGSYTGEEPSIEVIDGPQAQGKLFRITHRPEQRIEGKFPRRVQAVLAVDDLLVGAVLVALEADPELEKRFVEMLRGIARLRASGMERGPGEPSLADGTLSNPLGGYRLEVPAGWSLRESSNAQLLMLDRQDGPATFSILLKPRAGEVSAEFEMLAEGMRRRPGVEIVDERGHEVGGLPGIRMETRATVGDVSFSTRNYAG